MNDNEAIERIAGMTVSNQETQEALERVVELARLGNMISTVTKMWDRVPEKLSK